MSDELIAAQFMEHEKKKKKKKKDKVRSAWISFAGRIVAQIVGAAATVTLGVLVLHKYSGPEGRQTPKAHANYVEQNAEVGPMRAAGENSVAVLPMENFSADPEHDHFADAMTEVLIASLSKTHGLRVISRTSSMHFKGDRKPLRQIAQQLGARWIVEGSVAWADTRVRITAQLIEAETDQHAWAETYDRPATDVLALQAEVAEAIAQAVGDALPSRSALPSSRHAVTASMQ